MRHEKTRKRKPKGPRLFERILNRCEDYAFYRTVAESWFYAQPERTRRLEARYESFLVVMAGVLSCYYSIEDELVLWAQLECERGTASPALAKLATLSGRELDFQWRSYFYEALRELEIDWPDRSTILWHHAFITAFKMMVGELQPQAGAAQLLKVRDALREYGFERESYGQDAERLKRFDEIALLLAGFEPETYRLLKDVKEKEALLIALANALVECQGGHAC